MLLPGSLQPTLQAQMNAWQGKETPLFVPTLWRYEVRSTLAKSVHFLQLTAETANMLLDLALDLDISVVAPEESLCKNALRWTYRLKRASAYDSFYLALAESLNAEFWTADRKLANAVDKDWIHYAGT
jgi:predicted nucleic acid-binding protein